MCEAVCNGLCPQLHTNSHRLGNSCLWRCCRLDGSKAYDRFCYINHKCITAYCHIDKRTIHILYLHRPIKSSLTRRSRAPWMSVPRSSKNPHIGNRITHNVIVSCRRVRSVWRVSFVWCGYYFRVQSRASVSRSVHTDSQPASQRRATASGRWPSVPFPNGFSAFSIRQTNAVRAEWSRTSDCVSGSQAHRKRFAKCFECFALKWW